MNIEQAQVKEFHEKFGLALSDKPKVGSYEERKLRATVIWEEALEVLDALGFLPKFGASNLDSIFEDAHPYPLEDIAKELADLKYVVDGTGVALGIDLEPVFNAVHESNMSKTPGNNREDGKVLKGPDYKKPNIREVLDEQS